VRTKELNGFGAAREEEVHGSPVPVRGGPNSPHIRVAKEEEADQMSMYRLLIISLPRAIIVNI
jgi:hypothetical protein